MYWKAIAHPRSPLEPLMAILQFIYDYDNVDHDDAGLWPSGLARWLVDFVLAVVGSNPSHG